MLSTTVTIDGHPANVLHVELPDGQKIELQIEAGTLIQLRRVIMNTVTGIPRGIHTFRLP